MNKVLSSKTHIAIFVLPALTLYIIFALFPIVYNLYLSFFRTNLMSPGEFIGLRNYTNLFRDTTFIRSLRNNILLIFGSLLAHLPLALFFAHCIFSKVKGGKFFQTVFFLPTVIAGAAVGLMFHFVYHYEIGLVNNFLEFINLGHLRNQWLANTETVMISIIFVVMWRFVGYHMVIQLAAMKAIPTSLYESAEIDGASGFKKFVYITLPLIRPILRIDAILIITGSLKYFDLIFVMTGGGPNHASEVLATYMYATAFRMLRFGYASAIGMVLLLLCVVSVLISNVIFKGESVEY